MHLGIGLGITRLSGVLAAGPFSPLDLFGSGEEGAWYDPSDLSTVWQDAAGSTPATAGDPVGRIDDKSGNGNHATQSASTARPTLQTSGGLYYLDFDGVDDHLGPVTFASAQPAPNNISIAAKQNVVSGVQYFYDGPLGDRAYFLSRASPLQYEAGQEQVDSYGSPDTNDHVHTLSVGVSNTNIARIDGVVQSLSFNASLGNDWGGIYLGRRYSLSGYLYGRIYGYVGVNRTLTAGEISGVESYLAAKSGVTL